MLESMQKHSTRNIAKGDCISIAPSRVIATPIFRAFASSLKCLFISAWDNGSIIFPPTVANLSLPHVGAKIEEKSFSFVEIMTMNTKRPALYRA